NNIRYATIDRLCLHLGLVNGAVAICVAADGDGPPVSARLGDGLILQGPVAVKITHSRDDRTVGQGHSAVDLALVEGS
ncbi:hypothetical protein, partial [Escherichia coli]|uniref:hypothetical protein n=1 Tax=Escherichia coli TaxID=562 RepID=UPI0013CFF65F